MATLVTGRMVEDRSITLNDLTQSSGPLMFRNKIINGNFDIWQRGTSFSSIASEAYHADRWNVAYNGSGGTRTVTRQPFDLGQTNVPGEPTYFLRWDQSVAGTGATFNVLRQKIESVRSLANKQITVSFYAKAASAITVAVYGQQWFGTGGSPSSITYTNFPASLNITTSWQKFTVNLTVPSIADKNLGTNNDDRLEIIFALPINTTFTFDIAQVQVEEGTAATPFELRPIGMELQLCQRYYQKSYQQNVTPGSISFDVPGHPNTFATGQIICGWSFPTTMRARPLVNIYRPSTGNINQVENYVQTGARTVGSVESYENGIGLMIVDANVDNNFMQWHYTADAEL